MGKKTVETRIERTLKLEGNLSIYDAVGLREKLASLLKEADILKIDMAEISDCDTSGLQILCSTKKTADKEGKRILLEGISKVIEDAMIKTGIIHEMIAHDGGAGCQR